MDISKLGIDNYNGVKVVNFKDKYAIQIPVEDSPTDVIIYYIDEISDVEAFVNLVHNTNLPKDNRVIMVYEKGRKDGVNRDSIVTPFRGSTYASFKIRRPALCSLSKELSAFVQSYEG